MPRVNCPAAFVSGIAGHETPFPFSHLLPFLLSEAIGGQYLPHEFLGRTKGGKKFHAA